MAEQTVEQQRAQAAELFAAARSLFASAADAGLPVSTATRSMEPFLRGGERLVWRPPDPEPRLGDVVIFCQPQRARAAGEGDAGEAELDPERAVNEAQEQELPDVSLEVRRWLAGSLVVHRLVGRDARGRLVTKGDNLPHLDRDPVEPEAVLGVVRAVRERSGDLRSTEGRRAAVYGRAIAAASRFGAAVYRPAAAGDALLRRVVPGLPDRRVLRLLARAWQRITQGLLHAALYRPCHRWQPAPEEPPGRSPE